MKKLTLILISISCSLHTGNLFANPSLLYAAHDKLSAMASEAGHKLDKEARLSLAESSLLMPTTTAGIFLMSGILIPAVGGAMIGAVGGTVIGGLGGAIVGSFRGTVRAAVKSAGAGMVGGNLVGGTIGGSFGGSMGGGFTALLITLVGNDGSNETDPDSIYRTIYSVGNGHYRAELHYTMGSSGEEGSCLIYYTTVTFEIDDCSHHRIFPQEESGILRIGSKNDIFDKVLGQNKVVATGNHIGSTDSGESGQIVSNDL